MTITLNFVLIYSNVIFPISGNLKAKDTISIQNDNYSSVVHLKNDSVIESFKNIDIKSDIQDKNETLSTQKENDSLAEDLKNDTKVVSFRNISAEYDINETISIQIGNDSFSDDFKNGNTTKIKDITILTNNKNVNDSSFVNFNQTSTNESFKNIDTEDLEVAEDNIVFRPLFAYRQMQRKKQRIANRKRPYYYHPENKFGSFYFYWPKYPFVTVFPFG